VDFFGAVMFAAVMQTDLLTITPRRGKNPFVVNFRFIAGALRNEEQGNNVLPEGDILGERMDFFWGREKTKLYP
jgi:hypothetical protein